MKYKHIIYLMLLWLALPLLSSANTDVKGLFAKANQEYAKAKYTEALADYQLVLNSGYQSAALYFNVGNAYYKTDEIPSALLYYEKARRLAPGDDDINFNIRLTILKTTDRIEEAPEFFLNRWWRGFILVLPLSTLSILSIVLVILASLTLIGYLFSNSVLLKKTAFYVAISLFVLGFVTIFAGNRQSVYFANHRQAIIFSRTVLVKSNPTATSKTLFTLHEGTKVDVLETNNRSIRIKLANGSEGWIGVNSVKEI